MMISYGLLIDVNLWQIEISGNPLGIIPSNLAI